MKRYLFLYLMLALAIVSCSKKQDVDLSQFAKPEDFVSAEKPTEEVAMKLFFGTFGKKESTEWQADFLKDEKEVGKFAGKSKLYTSIELFETIKSAGTEKLVLITASNTKESDCAPFVSCFVFAKTDGKWRLESKDYYLSEIGSEGTCDPVKTIELGTNGEFGIIFTGVDETNAEYALVYAYYKNAFTEAIHFITANDDGGTDDQEWEFKSDYKFERGQDGWYDLVIKTTGNQYDSESLKLIDMNKTENYSFSAGKYVKKN